MADKSVESEIALIGSVLAGAKMPEYITPEKFSNVALSWVWDAVAKLKDEETLVDPITVGDVLERNGRLDEFMYPGSNGFSGRMALSILRDNGNRRDAESYAKLVEDYYIKRIIVREASQIANWALNGRTSEAILQDAINRLTAISPSIRSKTEHIKEPLQRATENTENALGRKFLKTGFTDLDDIITIHAPQLIVKAARPGKGKTALMLTEAYNMANDGYHVGFFSCEMASDELVMRLIAMETGIEYSKQLKGELTADEWDKFYAAREKLEKLPIYINDMPAITVRQIRREMRLMLAQHPIDIIFLDYIQIAGIDTEDKRNDRRRDQDIGEITRGLKAIAKDFSIPVITAAQMNRAVEQRAEKKPQLSDLRESGSIEQDADIVMFIYTDEKDPMQQNIRYIEVAKHRNGKIGTVALLFNGSRVRFENCQQRKVDFVNYDKD